MFSFLNIFKYTKLQFNENMPLQPALQDKCLSFLIKKTPYNSYDLPYLKLNLHACTCIIHITVHILRTMFLTPVNQISSSLIHCSHTTLSTHTSSQIISAHICVEVTFNRKSFTPIHRHLSHTFLICLSDRLIRRHHPDSTKHYSIHALLWSLFDPVFHCTYTQQDTTPLPTYHHYSTFVFSHPHHLLSLSTYFSQTYNSTSFPYNLISYSSHTIPIFLFNSTP